MMILSPQAKTHSTSPIVNRYLPNVQRRKVFLLFSCGVFRTLTNELRVAVYLMSWGGLSGSSITSTRWVMNAFSFATAAPWSTCGKTWRKPQRLLVYVLSLFFTIGYILCYNTLRRWCPNIVHRRPTPSLSLPLKIAPPHSRTHRCDLHSRFSTDLRTRCHLMKGHVLTDECFARDLVVCIHP